MKTILYYIKKKYTAIQLIVIGVIVFYAFFISEGSLIDRFRYDVKINELNGQIDAYKDQIAIDKQKIQQVESDKDHIEKFARENYLMKKEDEDVFIIE